MATEALTRSRQVSVLLAWRPFSHSGGIALASVCPRPEGRLTGFSRSLRSSFESLAARRLLALLRFLSTRSWAVLRGWRLNDGGCDAGLWSLAPAVVRSRSVRWRPPTVGGVAV